MKIGVMSTKREIINSDFDDEKHPMHGHIREILKSIPDGFITIDNGNVTKTYFVAEH